MWAVEKLRNKDKPFDYQGLCHGQEMALARDGHKEVQARKVATRVRHGYLTSRYDRHRAKPNPHVFDLICRREKVAPGEVIYVGDNPRKDFVGIKPLGFATVRILRGNYAHLAVDAAHEDLRRVYSLNEMTGEFLTSLFE